MHLYRKKEEGVNQP